MAFENILTAVDSGIMTITVNRPDKLNALNKNTIREIGEAVAAGTADATVRVMILTGAGTKAFVAGADISEFNKYTEAEGIELSRHGHRVFNSIEQCPKPVIAAINGFALGGGCELAMACHLRVASSNARFGQPEVKLGVIPGYGGTQRMTRLIGRTLAMELMLTADMMDAQRAYECGLVNAVVAPEVLMEKCQELAAKMLQQAPVALGAVIKCINDSDNASGFETEIREFGRCFVTEDFTEGTTAFLERRKPEFKGK